MRPFEISADVRGSVGDSWEELPLFPPISFWSGTRRDARRCSTKRVSRILTPIDLPVRGHLSFAIKSLLSQCPEQELPLALDHRQYATFTLRNPSSEK